MEEVVDYKNDVYLDYSLYTFNDKVLVKNVADKLEGMGFQFWFTNISTYWSDLQCIFQKWLQGFTFLEPISGRKEVIRMFETFNIIDYHEKHFDKIV